MTFDSPFSPPPGLTNPHLQTILSSVARKAIIPKPLKAFLSHTEEEIIEVADVRLVVHRNTQPDDPDAPLIMIIPGWLGNSRSSYVLSAALGRMQPGCIVTQRPRPHICAHIFFTQRVLF